MIRDTSIVSMCGFCRVDEHRSSPFQMMQSWLSDL